MSVTVTSRPVTEKQYAADDRYDLVVCGDIVIQTVRRVRSHFGGYHVYVSNRFVTEGDGFPVEYLTLHEARRHTAEIVQRSLR